VNWTGSILAGTILEVKIDRPSTPLTLRITTEYSNIRIYIYASVVVHMRDFLSILLTLVLLAGTGTAGMMMGGDGSGMMGRDGMGMMNGGDGSFGFPMMDTDEMHDWHEECELIMEEDCEGFDSEECQQMYEECEEHMQQDHQDEELYGDSEYQRDPDGDEKPENRRYGCSGMGY
jgi:hypothetical protein